MDGKVVAASVVGGVSLALIPITAIAFGSTAAEDAAARTQAAVQVQTQNDESEQDSWGGMRGMGRWASEDDADDATGSGRAWGCLGGGTGAQALALVDDDISDADAEALAFMVQEEKLAHDLYVALGDEWGLRIFDRIAVAETRHMESVSALLDAYGLEDPTEGLEDGEFADAELQELYDSLLAQGLESETAALEVGVTVEETDIADLQERETDEESVAWVFDRLETASTHHLAAFEAALED